MKFLNNIDGASKIVTDPNNRFVTDTEKVKISQIDSKVDKVEGKVLSTNDFTNIEKNKLAEIEDKANNYILETHDASKHSDIDQPLMKASIVQFAKVGVGTSSPNFDVDVVGDVRVRGEGSVKFGGVGASDVGFEMKYNNLTKSVDFNFLS